MRVTNEYFSVTMTLFHNAWRLLSNQAILFFIIMEIAGKSIKGYIQNLHHVARA